MPPSSGPFRHSSTSGSDPHEHDAPRPVDLPGNRDEPAPVSGWRHRRRAMFWSVVAAVGLYVGFAVWSDVRTLRDVLAGFRWAWLPAVLGLTLLNYTLRALRWHWMLRLLETPIGLGDSIRIFIVGLPMVLTPGKAGELVKSWAVKLRTDTPMSRTMPVVLGERVIDGLAMFVLAAFGLSGVPNPRLRTMALVVLAALLGAVVLSQIRPLALWFLDRIGRLPLLGRLSAGLRTFYESSYAIFRPRPFLIALGIGVISWLGEGLAYGVVVIGLGAAPTVETLLTAVFIFSIATIAGAVLSTPAGIGGVEGALLVLSMQLLVMADGSAMDRSTALAAALLIRLATLWFAVVIGLMATARWPQLLAALPRAGYAGAEDDGHPGR